MKENPPLVLASTSPRRRELITRLGLAFDLISVDVDESPRPGEPPEELVRRLSHAKAVQGVQVRPDALVVAADTVVALDHGILGKPRDTEDAVRMLKQLRGRAHVVYTGLEIASRTQAVSQVAETTVWMRDYADAEIAAYVATGDPLDKAAAYAIQHPLFHPVARIEGCYANVMGLPLCRVYTALEQLGVALPAPNQVLTGFPEDRCPTAQAIIFRE